MGNTTGLPAFTKELRILQKYIAQKYCFISKRDLTAFKFCKTGTTGRTIQQAALAEIRFCVVISFQFSTNNLESVIFWLIRTFGGI